MSEIKYDKKRLNPVKSILVSQPDPKDENSPFYRLARKYDLNLPCNINFNKCRVAKT